MRCPGAVPEDLLLHLCIHASHHHQFSCGLRCFYDIAETVARLGPALRWEVLVERTVLRGWQRGVYLALHLAGELSGAEVPRDILERLRPADLTDDIVATALALVLTDTGSSKRITVSCAKFLESRRLRDKIRLFWQRVFLSKAVIATQYSVPMDSVRIYGCYPRRLVDLLLRYGPTLWRFMKKDTSLTSYVERTNRLTDWLSGKRQAI